MPSRKKARKSSKPRKAATRTVHVFTDFDNTMIRENSAALFVKTYVRSNPHNEPFHRRLARAALLATPKMRRKHFSAYYACLRRVPHNVQHRILSGIHVRPRWLRAVKDIRMRTRSKTADVTIVTRNCIDVVHDWVMQNRGELRKNNVHIKAIVANGPLKDKDVAIVRERADLKHVDYIGFGQMLTPEKQSILGSEAIYIGDGDELALRPLVKEYIRI